MTFDPDRRWVIATGATVLLARVLRAVGRHLDEVAHVAPTRADEITVREWREIEAERLLDLPVGDAVDLLVDDRIDPGASPPFDFGRQKFSVRPFDSLGRPND
jgi:hypothetical protein